MVVMKKTNKKSRIVAVLNLKGGVGKTTACANIFRSVFKNRKASTLLIDLDPQFNLTQMLFTRDEYDDLTDERKTVFSVMEEPPDSGLFEINAEKIEPPLVREVASTLRAFAGKPPAAELSILAGDFRLVKYSLMGDQKKLAKVERRFKSFIEKARNEYSVIAIDCNPSSSFLTMCALSVCTHVLVPVTCDRYSVLGLELLDQYIKNIPVINPKPELVILVNNMHKSPHSKDVETELLAHPRFGKKVLLERMPYSTKLTTNPDYTGFAADKGGPYINRLTDSLNKLSIEIADRLEIK